MKILTRLFEGLDMKIRVTREQVENALGGIIELLKPVVHSYGIERFQVDCPKEFELTIDPSQVVEEESESGMVWRGGDDFTWPVGK